MILLAHVVDILSGPFYGGRMQLISGCAARETQEGGEILHSHKKGWVTTVLQISLLVISLIQLN